MGARLLSAVQERQARLREVHLQGGQLGGRAGEAHGRNFLMLYGSIYHTSCLQMSPDIEGDVAMD